MMDVLKWVPLLILVVLILILLVLVAYWISLPLLVVGLFFGCKYSLILLRFCSDR